MSTKPLADQIVTGANGAESATADEGAVRARDSFFRWCGTVDAIGQSTKREDKRALLEAYFSSVAEETFAPAGRFYCGSFFRDGGNGRTQIAERTVAAAIQDLARVGADEIREQCEAGGDLSEIASEAFAGRLPSGLSVTEVAAWGDELAAAAGTDSEGDVLRDMLARVSSLEALYLVRLIMGAFRIGVDPNDIDYAIARGHSAKARRSAAASTAQRPPESEAR
jgi:DNA ligase-1